jgi:hypothetical protein
MLERELIQANLLKITSRSTISSKHLFGGHYTPKGVHVRQNVDFNSWTEKMLIEILWLCPEAKLRNRSVTTSSIYVDTPDGYALRIGDHDGKEKYLFKWNLRKDAPDEGEWRFEDPTWRFYCSNAKVIAEAILKNVKSKGVLERWVVAFGK